MSYSCSFSGVRESNPYGSFKSLKECKKHCQSRPNKEIYLIYEDVVSELPELAPTDQIEIIKRLSQETLTLQQIPGSHRRSFWIGIILYAILKTLLTSKVFTNSLDTTESPVSPGLP